VSLLLHRNLFTIGVAGLLAASLNTIGQTSTRPSVSRWSTANPSPRQDPNSKAAHEQLVAKAKQGKIDLYFTGDSIVRRWGCTDPQWASLMQNWKQNFYGWNAGNFGWGADGLQNVLWRIQNGELEGVNPKVIVVLAGTNNVGNKPGGEEKVANILEGFNAIVETCHKLAPNAKIILTGIFPRNDSMDVIPEIVSINEKLSKLADQKSIFYVNINDKLADADGRLHEGMTFDNLHLTPKGYQIWADALKPILTDLLGPRGTTDHAPPPTGDPSAARPAKAS
jgi:lysophospholipase L1-like esterase